MTQAKAGARPRAIRTSDSNVFQMIKVGQRANDRSLDRAARLHQQQHRAFELTCQLIDHAVQNCDLALQMSRTKWIERSELGARRLYAKIALFWAWNVPMEYRKELQFRSDRLKEVVRRLQEFRESTRFENGMPRDPTTDGKFAPPLEMSEAAGVIQFPRDRKPARRTKKRKAGDPSRIFTLSER